MTPFQRMSAKEARRTVQEKMDAADHRARAEIIDTLVKHRYWPPSVDEWDRRRQAAILFDLGITELE